MSSDPNLPDTTPPAFPSIDPKVLRHKFRVLAWARVGLGGLAGAVAAFTGFTSINPPEVNVNAYYGFYIAVFVYMASYYLAKYGLGLNLPPKQRTKIWTQGIGSYIMMFMFFWILLNTVLYLQIA